MEPPCLPPPAEPGDDDGPGTVTPLDVCVRLWHTTIYLRGTGLNTS